jgi:16S rRNA U1498 N3-methylase RsmE
LEYAAEKGVKSFSLGRHTLRAETAALAATVIVLDKLG